MKTTLDALDFPEYAPNGAALRSNYALVANDALQIVSGMFEHEAAPESLPIIIKLAACRRKKYRTRIFRINADLKLAFIKKSAKISAQSVRVPYGFQRPLRQAASKN